MIANSTDLEIITVVREINMMIVNFTESYQQSTYNVVLCGTGERCNNFILKACLWVCTQMPLNAMNEELMQS